MTDLFIYAIREMDAEYLKWTQEESARKAAAAQDAATEARSG